MADEKTDVPAKGRKAAPAQPDWDKEKEVEHAFAEGMGDGEIIEGRYLGFDTAVTKNGMKARHRFQIVDAKGDLKLKTIWGAAELNAKLAECKLGRETFVRRDGREIVVNERTGKEMEGKKVLYTVKQRGPVEMDGVIGRPGDQGRR